jgi:hypothetical protein
MPPACGNSTRGAVSDISTGTTVPDKLAIANTEIE